MNVIIDECVPYIVKRRLPERQIITVQEMGWAGIKNGELLRLVEENFEIFITSDKNLKYQQNLVGRNLAIILLPGNQVPIIENLLSKIDDVLDTIQRGSYVEI